MSHHDSTGTQVRIGIVGGGRGWVFASLFASFPESRVSAIAERLPGRREAIGRAHPEAQLFCDYETMLAEADLDAVVVASDPPAHAEHVVLALDAGKHALSEVPASLTAAGHFKVLEATQRSGNLYMLGENCCYWWFVREWQRLYRAGELGEISYGEAEYLHDMVRSHFRDAAGQVRSHEEAGEPDVSRNWRARFHPIQYLTHSLGPLLWVTGDRCVSVSCQATPANRDPVCGSPDIEAALFRTAAGRVLRVVCGFNTSHPIGHRFSLLGTEATVQWAGGANLDQPRMARAEWDRRHWTPMSWSRMRPDAPEEARDSGHGGADWFLARSFLDAMLSGEEPELGVHRSMDISFPGVCAAISAEREGEAVPIPDTRDRDAVAEWRGLGYQEPWPSGSSWRARGSGGD
jgi:predicted dehydrogenase